MVDQGVHLAECGFVDDASPGKLSDFTSIDCSESIVVSFFNASFNSSIKATEIAGVCFNWKIGVCFLKSGVRLLKIEVCFLKIGLCFYRKSEFAF